MTAPEREPSALLERVFDEALLDGPFSVLDMGGASPETLAFLSGRRCTVTVTGLLQDGFVPEPPGEDDPYRAHRAFQERLSFLGQRQYDVCLFWDYPNYLPLPTLRAFAEVLTGHLHPRSRAHLFAGLNPRHGLPSLCYGVIDEQTFSVRPRNRPPLSDVHSQGEIADAFHYLKIHRSSLRDGRVEVVMGGE